LQLAAALAQVHQVSKHFELLVVALKAPAQKLLT
jgi:hypothetical protein